MCNWKISAKDCLQGKLRQNLLSENFSMTDLQEMELDLQSPQQSERAEVHSRKFGILFQFLPVDSISENRVSEIY